MSKFRVGQRVRIRIANNFPHMVGREASIVGDGISRDWSLDIDGYGARDEMGRVYVADSYQLESATDSYDVVSWDACVWKPEHLRVGA